MLEGPLENNQSKALAAHDLGGGKVAEEEPTFGKGFRDESRDQSPLVLQPLDQDSAEP